MFFRCTSRLLLLLLLQYFLRIDPYPDRTDREPFQNITIDLFVATTHVILLLLYLLRTDPYPDRTGR